LLYYFLLDFSIRPHLMFMSGLHCHAVLSGLEHVTLG